MTGKNRKLYIWLITSGVVLLVFLLYSFISVTPSISVDAGLPGSTDEVNMSDFGEQLGQIGDAKVGSVKKARYTHLDKNKKVDREFGFERLLHESGNEWEIEEPYMKVFKPGLRCDITADTGTVEVETIAGKPSPTDGVLSGNVIIHLLPHKAGSSIKESFVYLDDVFFTSKRSEFSTDGPVRFVSEDAKMVGTGMKLVYNDELNRLELLRIIDLDYLRLKTAAGVSIISPSRRDTTAPAATSVAETATEPGTPPTAPATVPAKTPKSSSKPSQKLADLPEPADENKNKSEPPRRYYKCTFRENVVIQYGQQTIFADEVTLNNIFLSDNSAGKTKSGQNNTPKTHAPPIKTAPKSIDDIAEPAKNLKARKTYTDVSTDKQQLSTSAQHQQGEPAQPKQDFVDVIVTCDKGIEVTAMEFRQFPGTSTKSTTDRTIECVGRPIHVKTIKPSTDFDSNGPGENIQRAVTIVKCERISYNLDSNILDLSPGRYERLVSLATNNSDGKLQTTRSVRLDRNANTALINGPGTVFLGTNKACDHQRNHCSGTQMKFNGIMKVYFADSLTNNYSSTFPAIKYIDLTGGLSAVMLADGSRVAADSAIFLFDDDSKVSQANLRGNVRFDSARGNLAADRADVFFAANDAGAVYAETVQSYGHLTMKSANTKDRAKETVFRAKKIDYDAITGNTLALGPVEYTFYTSGLSDSTSTRRSLPVTITAQKHAQYFAEDNRAVFEKNVVGTILEKGPDYDETNKFYGQKLIVSFAANRQPNSRPSPSLAGSIEQVTVTDGVVKLETFKTSGGKMLSGTALKCFRIDYDAEGKLITATGPGLIVMNNANAPTGRLRQGELSLRRQCYVIVRDFEKLQWLLGQRRIIADGKTRAIRIDYIPLVNGQYGNKTSIDASHIEVDFTQTPEGKEEISAITATGGIYYKEVNTHEFAGSKLFYDAHKSLITINGSESWPCIANGVFVDSIEYDLQTSRISAELTGGIGALYQEAFE